MRTAVFRSIADDIIISQSLGGINVSIKGDIKPLICLLFYVKAGEAFKAIVSPSLLQWGSGGLLIKLRHFEHR